jgi:hypothetical protein
MFRLFAPVFVVLFLNQIVSANAFVRGAYYRLGDDDAGAAAGALGNDPTKDSFSDGVDLSRFSSPHYSADVPANGPIPNKLSMIFSNIPVAGPTGYYGRAASLDMIQQGYALETWVKSPDGTIASGGFGPELIAYNGDPTANGFGFYRDGANYVARIGAFQRTLGPAGALKWHHLAYVQSLGTESYYYDGKLVTQTTTDPLPTAATGGFWLAGRSTATGAADLFSGYIDEVRYQSFNPLAAGAFEPTNFLITVPEPGAVSICLMAMLLIGGRRNRLRRI